MKAVREYFDMAHRKETYLAKVLKESKPHLPA
jgi:hypothetical protein